MRVVVIGAGVAGLGTALALRAGGHDVTILERDATPMPATADEAFGHWERRGAPQVRHSHAFLARLRNLLRDRAPSVLDALLAAGATEIRFTENLPETLTDRGPRPGDADLVGLACRRTTFEWVLRSQVLATEGVALRDGVVVDGLSVCDGRVVGVHAEGGALIAADLVVDATGPRTGSPGWLAAAGVAEPPADEFASEIVYFSRFYRLRPGTTLPAVSGPVAGDLGYLKYAVFLGDNDTFSLTIAVASDDAELRSLLGTEAGIEAVAGLLVNAAPWLDGRAEPITGVHPMGGLRNRRRHLVADGEPIVLGYVAVGDAAICTNPLYGRGCSLALVHAFAVADALAEHPEGTRAFSLAVDELTERELGPWYRQAVIQDRESIDAARANVAGRDAAASGAAASDGYVDPKAFMREVFRDGLMPAVRTSPAVFRAFLRWFNLLADPNALMSDGEVIGAVMDCYQTRAERPPEPVLGPASREQLLASA